MVSVLDFYAASYFFFELGRGSKPNLFKHFYLSVKFVFIVVYMLFFFYLDRNFYVGRYSRFSQLE